MDVMANIVLLDLHLDSCATAKHANTMRDIRISPFGTYFVHICLDMVVKEWERKKEEASKAVKKAYEG